MESKKRKKIVLVLLLMALLLMGGGIMLYMQQSYTIKFDSVGGEILSDMKVSRKVSNLPVPVKAGESFLGWTTTSDGTDYLYSTKRLSGSTTLYAQWTDNNYVVNFYSEGENIKNLSYTKNTKFTSDLLNSSTYPNTVNPYRDFWIPAVESTSSHSAFKGWQFKDIQGNDAWLWYNDGAWLLESIDYESSDNYYSSKSLRSYPFEPHLYDNTMHAVWDYKTVTISYMTNKTGYPGIDDWSPSYDTTINLHNNWYSGTDAIIGWKIGFKNENNSSPLKVSTVSETGSTDIMTDNRVTGSKLSTAALQKINTMFDTVYQTSEQFYLDPLLSYLAFQNGSTQTLYLYPVTTEGQGSKYYVYTSGEQQPKTVTDGSETVKISNGGNSILLGMPKDRTLRIFDHYYYDTYNASGIKTGTQKVYKSDIEAAIKAGNGGVSVAISDLHRTNATIFYEVWTKKSVDITFNYGTAAKKVKGYYDAGIRRIKDINFASSDIKDRYVDATPIAIKTDLVGNYITLPSASMYAMPNMSFIGWQEVLTDVQIANGQKPGRIYPAGYNYQISDDFYNAINNPSGSYALKAVWSDSLVNFSFNLDSGRGFTPTDINVLRGSEDTMVTLPAEAPTRYGYSFVRWESNKKDEKNGNKYQYQPGDQIRVMSEKQILTAIWEAKTVQVTLTFSYENKSGTTVTGSIAVTGKYDDTIRLQDISTTNSNASAQAISDFKELYKLVGWTFKLSDDANSKAVTYGVTQSISLNQTIVREVSSGGATTLQALGVSVNEKTTVDLTVWQSYGIMADSGNYSYNSYATLTYNYYYTSFVVPAGKNLTHDFLGFFALPVSVVETSNFKISDYWDNSTGTYKTNGSVGQFLQFAGGAVSYKVTEPTYLFLWLKPKAVSIEYYGIYTDGTNKGQVTTNPIYTETSYFGDERRAYTNLGANLDKIPGYSVSDFEYNFIDWSVEYYSSGSTLAFYIESVTPNASGGIEQSLLTDLTNITGNGTEPVSTIKLIPNVQSRYDFLVRIVDDGTLTGVKGKTFDYLYSDVIKYTNGGSGLALDDVNSKLTLSLDELKKAKVYLPGYSADSSYVSLGEILDSKSMGISHFLYYTSYGTWQFNFGNEVLFADVATQDRFNANAGSVLLYPVFKEVEYTVVIKDNNTILAAYTGLKRDGNSVPLGDGFDFNGLTRAGYYYNKNGLNLSAINYLDDAYINLPRDSKVGSFRIESGRYQVSASSGQINYKNAVASESGYTNVISLYIVWLQCDVIVQYTADDVTSVPSGSRSVVSVSSIIGNSLYLSSSAPDGWYRNGFTFGGWSTRINSNGYKYNAAQRVTLSTVADTANGILNATSNDNGTGTFTTTQSPYMITWTVKLYPVWNPTTATTVKLVLNRNGEAPKASYEGNDATMNALLSSSGISDVPYWSYLNIETKWSKFKYNAEEDMYFVGWYYIDVNGKSWDLTVENGQIHFNDIFLDGNIMRKNIEIYAKWSTADVSLFSFDIEKEAYQVEYDLGNNTTEIVWDTKYITGISKLDQYTTTVGKLISLVGWYTTVNVPNYAYLDRDGNTINDGKDDRGFVINNVYTTLVYDNLPSDKSQIDNRFIRRGYELVGFAIDGVRYDKNSGPYKNYTLTSPVPDSINLVPIYEPRKVTINFDLRLDDLGLAAGNITENYSSLIVDFESRINLPYVNTQGLSPYTDEPYWLSNWRYDVDGTPVNISVENFSNYLVSHDPAAGALEMRAVWNDSLKSEVYFYAVLAQTGKTTGSGAVTQIKLKNFTTYSDYVTKYSGHSDYGSVAEHYRKPTLKNGTYDYSNANYTIPASDPTVLDSSFDMTGLTTGMRVVGWYREKGNTGTPDLTNPCTNRIVTMRADEGSSTDKFRVYLVYEWIDGTVVYNENHSNAVFTGTRTVAAKYNDVLTLPTESVIKLSGKYLGGWTKDVALGTMRGTFTSLDAANAAVNGWVVNDFVKVVVGGVSNYYRWDGSALIYQTIYTTTYTYDNTLDHGIVTMYAVWEDLIVEHTFWDGTIQMTDAAYKTENNIGFSNGTTKTNKYYYDKVYGEGMSSALPTPQKEGHRFVRWVDVNGNPYINGTTKCLFKISSSAKLYAEWEINYYTLAFNTNGGDSWSGAPNYSTSAKQYGSNDSLRIPQYDKDTDFAWNGAETRLFLGWTLVKDNAAFIIDTRTTYCDIKFWNVNIAGTTQYTIKADNYSVITDSSKNIRTVTLYALWSTGVIDINYYVDNGSSTLTSTALYSQSGYLFNAARTELSNTANLAVPGVDSDYLTYGVMVADDSILPADHTGFNGANFVGWRVVEGPESQFTAGVGKLYYPGDFLEGTIRDSIKLVPEWAAWTTDWRTSTAEIISIPSSGANAISANYFNTAANAWTVSNTTTKRIIFPRLTNGIIGEGMITAHNVERIILPSVGGLYVYPQAIRAAKLKSIYISDDLNGIDLIGNIIGGSAKVETSGAITITSAMEAYIVKQGKQTYETSISYDGQSTKYAYITNNSYKGTLYSKDQKTLLAYPGNASSVNVLSQVTTIKSYSFAYMANDGLTTLAAVTPSTTSIESRAIYHSKAATLRLPISGISDTAVSGYQPNLTNVAFGVTDTATSAANFTGGILYHGNSQVKIMYVTRTVTNADTGLLTIPNTITGGISEYALSSFYLGLSGKKSISSLTVNATIALDKSHFQDVSSTYKGQHAYYLTTMTIGGNVSSLDARIFEGNSKLTSLTINKNGLTLANTTGFSDTTSFPIFVPGATIATEYLNAPWSTFWNKNAQNNNRVQTLSKAVSYNAGTGGSGSQTITPAAPSYGGVLTIPDCAFTSPLGKAFIGWHVTSANSGINGKIYQPGRTFTVGMTNSNGALNIETPYAGAEIYIQSSITLTAVWEEYKIQFIAQNGSLIPINVAGDPSSVTLYIKEGGIYREATGMEIAGKKVNTTGDIVDDYGTYNFYLPGSNATFTDATGNYAFVGWILRTTTPAATDSLWKWSTNANVSGRIVPDGISVDAVNIKTAATVKKYHALYDLASTNISYSNKSDILATASAKATSKSGTGDNGTIAIPAAVLDTAVSGAASPRGFMRKVVEIGSVNDGGAFSYMTSKITKLYVGGNVTNINAYAFAGNMNVTTLEFGHNYADGLSDLKIGDYAFAYCSKLSSVSLPLVTTEIGAKAFLECLELTQATFEPNKGGAKEDARLTTIGASAFESCRKLTTFYVTKNVTSIGLHAFTLSGIQSFSSYYARGVAGSNGKYVTSTANDLCYQTSTGTITLHTYSPGKSGVVNIDNSNALDGITRIGAYAFAFNQYIKTVDIPANIVVGEGVFAFCPVLETVKINAATPSILQGGDLSYSTFKNVICTIKVPYSSGTIDAWTSQSIYSSIKRLFVGY